MNEINNLLVKDPGVITIKLTDCNLQKITDYAIVFKEIYLVNDFLGMLFGAKTFCIMTFAIMTISIMTPSITI
jgi:hypothetical protein